MCRYTPPVEFFVPPNSSASVWDDRNVHEAFQSRNLSTVTRLVTERIFSLKHMLGEGSPFARGPRTGIPLHITRYDLLAV